MQERINIVEVYLMTRSVVQSPRRLWSVFPGRNALTKIIWSAAISQVRAENHIVTVIQCLEQSLRKSIKHLTQETNFSRNFVMRIMNQNLHLFQYKLQILQFQIDTIKTERAFGQTICQRIEDFSGFLDFIFFCDEANFHFGSYVNKQNTRF